MPAPDPIILSSLEGQITVLSGKTRLAFYPSDIPTFEGDKVKSLLRSWLIEMGMDRRKTFAASNVVLANAYRAGEPYIAKVNLEDNQRRLGGRPRGFSPVQVDLDGPLDLLNQPIAEPAPAPRPNPLYQKPDPYKPDPKPEPKIDPPFNPINGLEKLVAEAVGRAADQILPKRIDEAIQALNARADQAIEDFALSPETQNQLSEIAARTAKKLFEEMVPRRLEIIHPDGKVIDLGFEPRHEVFDQILSLLACGEHVYMVGPAGTGKTHLFHQLGKALNRKVTPIGQTLTKYEFSGFMSPTGEYVGTPLRTAVEEGHLLAIDEIDMSAAAAIGFLNSLTANRYVTFPDKMVEAHPDFVVIAAANTFGHGATMDYIGRNPLDAASLDRFSYVTVGYDHKLETQIYGPSAWLDYVHRVREACDKIELRHIISMRAIERGLKCLQIGHSADKTCKIALWRNLDQDSINRIKSIAGEFRIAPKLEEVA